MAHNIMERDNLFTVRKPAWHGIGDVLDDYPNRTEAQQIAHPWEPVTESVFTRSIYCDDAGNPQEVYEEIPDSKAVTRSDDNRVLGVVGKDYEPVTNTEMWDIAEALQDNGGSVKYETGGSLNNGAKVWLLLRLDEPILENKEDPNAGVIPYYALQNAHDGSGAFRGQATMTRIVCDNTARMSDLDARARGTEFTFKHTKNVKSRIDEARAALAGWRESISEWNRTVEHLSGMIFDPEQVERFITTFIPAPAPHIATDRVMSNVEQARQTMRNLLDGETLEGINRNGYGLVQASIEYSQHYRLAHTSEGRFKRAYLDDSKLTRDAVKLVGELV